MDIVQLIQFTPEQLNAERQAIAEEAARKAVSLYVELTDPPRSRDEIMQKLGIKDRKKFYRIRQEKQIQPAGRNSNADMYRLSDFMK